jgi:hypothetical protein
MIVEALSHALYMSYFLYSAAIKLRIHHHTILRYIKMSLLQ